MRLDFHGGLVDEPRVRAGCIGCGSHAFRNVYPAMQFAPVELVATCDLSLDKAQAFARQFGAQRAFDDHRRMLETERLEAVFIVVGYDAQGRPMYPKLATEALHAGCHVWMEKPPAAAVAELIALRRTAEQADRHVLVGFKKAFAPANRKAKRLMQADGFTPHLLMLQYPQSIPTAEQFAAYRAGEREGAVVSFLDHLCHPASLMVELFGRPDRLSFVRSHHGGGVASFTWADGRVATLALTAGQSSNGGMERTTIVGTDGRHIVVENNQRVTLFRHEAKLRYGASPDFYLGDADQAAAVWQPECSLGQLYNKSLFLLGYYDEVNDFARGILDGAAPERGGIEQAIDVTAIFEAFHEGPQRVIRIGD